MARGLGSRAALAGVFESTYGTAPVSGYRTFPFASEDLGAEQPLLENELLGFGRDPLAPSRDAITAGGQISIPLDVENLGFWLKAAFGAPVTTGTTPKVHTFASGGFVLPSMSLEKQMPDVPHFAMQKGCMLNKIMWTMQRSGLLRAEVEIISQGETIAGTTAAGTPTSYALQRFSHFSGAINRNGSALANVEQVSFEYMNNLDPVETIRADGLIEGVDPTIASLSGEITMRFADQTLLTQAINGTSCEISATYSLGANAQFSFTAHEVYLPRPKIAVEGPDGIRASFRFQAAKAALTPFRLCTAVLTNTVATY
jgi:hypothetical protein